MSNIMIANVPPINNLADLCQFIDSVGSVDEAFKRIEAKANSIYAMEIVGESSSDTVRRLTRKFNLLKLSLTDLCQKTDGWCDHQWRKHFETDDLNAPPAFKEAINRLPLAYKYMLFTKRALISCYRPSSEKEPLERYEEPWYLIWLHCHEIQETLELSWELPGDDARSDVGLKKVVSKYGPAEPYNGSSPTKKLIVAETSWEYLLCYWDHSFSC